MNAMPSSALVLGVFVFFSGSTGWAETLPGIVAPSATRSLAGVSDAEADASGKKQVVPSRLRFRQGPVCMCESGLSEKDIQSSTPGHRGQIPPAGQDEASMQ